MANERRWLLVEVQPLSSNGGSDGSVVVASTSGFKVKQTVKIDAIGEKPTVLEVKRVLSPTTLLVGPIDRNINTRANLSIYTTAKTSTIRASEQEKRGPTDKDIHSFVYEQEPTVAYRTINVDEWGKFYSLDNPFPVQLSDGSIKIGTVNAELEVQLSHRDNYPDAGDIHDSVRIGGASGGEADVENNALNVNVKSIVGEKTIPVIQNISAALASNEYKITIPQATKSYEVSCRGTAKVQYSYIQGQTNNNYKTIYPGYVEIDNGLKLGNNLDIYFEVNKPNQLIEVKIWS